MSSSEQTRDALRKEYRARRNNISNIEQLAAAKALLARCLDYPAFVKARSIACYLPNDAEVHTHDLIQYCWKNSLEVLLPLIDPEHPGHLLFLKHQATWPLQQNKYGIEEPKFNPLHLVELKNIDIIFTPLVAFDKKGNRLGMGGGYYDRTLANLGDQKRRPLVVGLAHDCQLSENLPVQSWDIPLHSIITPSQIFAL